MRSPTGKLTQPKINRLKSSIKEDSRILFYQKSSSVLVLGCLTLHFRLSLSVLEIIRWKIWFSSVKASSKEPWKVWTAPGKKTGRNYKSRRPEQAATRTTGIADQPPVRVWGLEFSPRYNNQLISVPPTIDPLRSRMFRCRAVVLVGSLGWGSAAWPVPWSWDLAPVALEESRDPLDPWHSRRIDLTPNRWQYYKILRLEYQSD